MLFRSLVDSVESPRSLSVRPSSPFVSRTQLTPEVRFPRTAVRSHQDADADGCTWAVQGCRGRGEADAGEGWNQGVRAFERLGAEGGAGELIQVV